VRLSQKKKIDRITSKVSNDKYNFQLKQNILKEAIPIRQKIRDSGINPTIIYYNSYEFGFADIIRGLLSTYALARYLDLPFKIYIPPSKCQLTEFLIPNKVDWSFKEYIRITRNNILEQTDSKSYTSIKKIYKQFQQSKYWVITSNQFLYFDKEYKKHPHFQRTKIPLIKDTKIQFKQLFNDLFVPSPKFQKILNPYLNQMKDKYNISIHIRESDLDFKNELKKDYSPIFKCINSKVKNKSNKQFWLFGNSPAFFKQSEDVIKDNIIITSRIKSHVDSGNCNSLEGCLLDWYLIGECNVTFFSVGGFSATASFRSNIDLYQIAKCYDNWSHVLGNENYLPCCTKY
jgi:hypothetical protein